ncbi:MAG: transcriptional repressor LexA [Leptospirales bacterium]
MTPESPIRESKPLTSRQRDVFDFIVRWIRETRFPPTLSEVAQFLGVPYPKSASAHLDALEKKGYIQRYPGKARGIQLTPLGESFQQNLVSEDLLVLPIVGRVRAGRPTDNQMIPDGTLSVPRILFTEKPDFILKVQGDSMTGAGIFEGDFAFIRKTRDVRSGDLVVAQMQGEITLKQFLVQKNRIVLRAANPRYPDRVVSPEEEENLIQGRLVGLYRDQSRSGKGFV